MRPMMTTLNNLPSEPEDIFADTDESSTTASNTQRPIPPVNPPIQEAIETPIDSSDSTNNYSPQVLTPTATLLPADTETTVVSDTNPSRTRRIPTRLIIIIAIVIGGILLLGGIVWGGYYWYTHSRGVTVETDVTPLVIDNVNVIVPVNVNPVVTNTNTIPVNTSTVQYADSDHDGLSDDEETEVNTNPLKKDTDEDGLSDREEVRVYLTDPRNVDTDEDGYIDGEEVANFYHPNHPDPKKRLFDIPQ